MGRYGMQLGSGAGFNLQLRLRGCVLLRRWVGEEKEIEGELLKLDKYTLSVGVDCGGHYTK